MKIIAILLDIIFTCLIAIALHFGFRIVATIRLEGRTFNNLSDVDKETLVVTDN